MRKLHLHIILSFAIIQIASAGETPGMFTQKDYVIALKKVTDVMVNDVTSPVAASRYYAYVTIASEQTCSMFKPATGRLSGLLNNYSSINIDTLSTGNADKSYAVVFSLLKMGEKLLPSGYILTRQLDSISKVAGIKGLSKNQIKNTEELVGNIVLHLLKYVRSDGFAQLSGMPRYTPKQDPQYWQPTAPAFMQPVEPYWKTLRPFILDSAGQFKPLPAVVYDSSKQSKFFKLMKDVYVAGRKSTQIERNIANFWDCNPFALQQIGHVEFGIKKISPGGHWLGITGIACLKKKVSFDSTVFIHAVVSIALADAFISCWEEKFRSDRVRPETCINSLIDPLWRPLLQTPPFPEYPSGHSVISAAAAVVLTRLLGDNLSFTDDTEVEFGLPTRTFKSFRQASNEAGISRLYGGIHYNDAIVNGQKQGVKVGTYIIKKLDKIRN